MATGRDSGNWNMKVLNVKEDTIVKGGNSSDNKTTKQKFIIIKLQLKNITTSPVQYAADEFKLSDNKTKNEFNSAFDAMQSANGNETIYKSNNEFVGVYDDVNPNTPKLTYIIFEVPKNFNIADGVLMNKAEAQTDAQGFNIQ